MFIFLGFQCSDSIVWISLPYAALLPYVRLRRQAPKSKKTPNYSKRVLTVKGCSRSARGSLQDFHLFSKILLGG